MKIKLIEDIPGYKAREILSRLAEEMKEEIDMEEVRERYNKIETITYDPEVYWFTAYRIVKHVIEKLDENTQDTKGFELMLNKYGNNIEARDRTRKQYHCGFLPSMSKPTADKVIELCDKELQILFLKN